MMKYVFITIFVAITGCNTPEPGPDRPPYATGALRTECRVDIIKNDYEVTDRTRRDIEGADWGCRRIYGDDYCLIKFELVGPLNYHATCGRKNEHVRH